MFRGVVSGAVGDSGEPGDGGDVDDGAAVRLEHLFSEGFAEQEGRDEIHFEHAAIVGPSGFFGGRDVADAGVVDQDIGASVFLEDLFGEGGDGDFVGGGRCPGPLR